jgi:hypothetical protein
MFSTRYTVDLHRLSLHCERPSHIFDQSLFWLMLQVCKHWLRGLCKKSDMCEFLHEYDESKMPECYFYATYGMVHRRLYNKSCIDGEGRWRVRLFHVLTGLLWRLLGLGDIAICSLDVAHSGLGGHELKRATLLLVRKTSYRYMKRDISSLFPMRRGVQQRGGVPIQTHRRGGENQGLPLVHARLLQARCVKSAVQIPRRSMPSRFFFFVGCNGTNGEFVSRILGPSNFLTARIKTSVSL